MRKLFSTFFAFSALVLFCFGRLLSQRRMRKPWHKLHRYSHNPIQSNRCDLSKTINKSCTSCSLSCSFSLSLAHRNQSTFPIEVGLRAPCAELFFINDSWSFSLAEIKHSIPTASCSQMDRSIDFKNSNRMKREPNKLKRSFFSPAL